MSVLSRSLTLTGACLLALGSSAIPLTFGTSDGVANAAVTPAPLHPRSQADLIERGLYRAQSVAQGHSRILWADRSKATRYRATGTRDERARAYLRHHATGLHVSPDAVAGTHVQLSRTMKGGASVVVFGQRHGELDVYGARSAVLMDSRGELVAISGELHPALRAPSHYNFKLGQEEAIARALAKHFAVAATSLAAKANGRRSGEYANFALAKATKKVPVSSDIRSKAVLYPVGPRLEPAYYVEFFATNKDTGNDEAFALLVSAQDGTLLHRASLTQYEAFKYRVWAEDNRAHTPMDGPVADMTPHPTGKPDQSQADKAAPVLVEIEGFNHNPDGAADPWLDAGATESKGNNVDAYSDHDQVNDPNTGAAQNDGFTSGDIRAEATASGVFDRVYDVTKGPMVSDEQVMAAVTQLFYTNNWLHDYWYDSGFDEAAGNAQDDNFGRGGAGNDHVRAEAQDSADDGQRNNANMSTPADGSSPRMQMFLWSNVDKVRSLTPTPKPAGYEGVTGQALFGPADFELTGDIVLADDGTDPVTDGCEAPTNDVNGKILVVEIGALNGGAAKCKGVVRAKLAQDAGAKGLIFVGNADTAPTLGNDPTQGVTIPGMGLAKPDGDLLIAALKKGDSIEVKMVRETQFELDGTIDNQIVAHEWGHYLHHRLIPQCSSPSCGGMSEGWGDFIAFHLTHRETDPYDAVYGMAGYATASMSADNYYFGIRRYPYSVKFDANPLTFKHVTNGVALPTDVPFRPAAPDNAEVHNAGEVWAVAMIQASQELFNASRGANPRLSYDEAKRRIADYVVIGMQMTPSEPTYTEQRDAILAAAMANDPLDHAALAQGFATRGLGSCAEAPPASSTTNAEAVEAFGLQGRLHFTGFQLTDSIDSCNDDGVLDLEEKGELILHLFNASSGDVAGGKAKITVDDAVLDLDKLEVDVPAISSMTSYDLKIPAQVADKVKGREEVKIAIELTAQDSCEDTINVNVVARLNADAVSKASLKDNVEAMVTAWTVEQDAGDSDDAWVRAPSKADDHANWGWYGDNLAVKGESSLVSPKLEVSESDDFHLKFSHAYAFDSDTVGSQTRNFDGAVIEVSKDDGANWEDASKYAEVPYTGKIADGLESDNPLKGREGFVGRSGDDLSKLSEIDLDFGDKLAGETVQVRLRIGSDAAVGAIGWALDDFEVTGVDNKPFTELVDHDPDCEDDDTTGDDDDDSSDDDDDSSDDDDDSGTDDDDDASDDDDDASGSDDDDDASDDDDDASGSDDDDDASEDVPASGCGCAATPSQGFLGVGAGLFLALAGRRRRRQS